MTYDFFQTIYIEKHDFITRRMRPQRSLSRRFSVFRMFYIYHVKKGAKNALKRAVKKSIKKAGYYPASIIFMISFNLYTLSAAFFSARKNITTISKSSFPAAFTICKVILSIFMLRSLLLSDGSEAK